MSKKTERDNFLKNKELMGKTLDVLNGLIEKHSVAVDVEFSTDHWSIFFYVYRENKEPYANQVMLGMMPHRAQKHFDDFVAWVAKEFPE